MNLPNAYSKPKNFVPKYESVEHHETLAITIAPCDKYQFVYSEDRLNDFHKCLRLKLTSICRNHVYLQLRTEISSNGRLHFHGYVTVRERLNLYLYVIPRLEDIATVVIKTMTDAMEWDNYCQKQGISQEWMLIPLLQTKNPINNTKDLQKSKAKRKMKRAETSSDESDIEMIDSPPFQGGVRGELKSFAGK